MNTKDQLTLFRVDSLANHSAKQASNEAKEMIDTYFHRCSGLSEKLNLSAWLEKMFMELPKPHCRKLNHRWRIWDISPSLSIFQLRQVGHCTEDLVFGSLVLKKTHSIPTPTASDHIERKCTSKEMLNFNTNKSVSLDRWFRKAYGRELTPEFSELLMGYPIGWTELKE